MSATDHFSSIDVTLANIREAHQREMQSLKDELMKCQLEASLHKDAAVRAIEARASAERIAQTLLTEFGLVSLVFERAKKLALESGWIDPNALTPPPPPVPDSSSIEGVEALMKGAPL